MTVRAPRRVELRAQRVEVDRRPRLLLAGEVHYFRLPPERWGPTLRLARRTGVDTIATYIPWLWHETPDGSIDLAGRTHPRRDVLGFLELCAAEGLDVIARPGPFVMAELKNEGIPSRVLREHPELPTVGWDGRRPATRTVDYLAPAFLDEIRGWWGAVLPELVERQASAGGPIVAVQLDNEVGMLDWVANAPELNDGALADLDDWRTRTGRASGRPEEVRAGASGTDRELVVHRELGLVARDRYARYLRTLEDLARASGIAVPLLVNVHGTSAGRGRTFPIGVSQLAPAWRGRPGVAAGADSYLGDLDVGDVADLYVDNAILTCVDGPDQPSGTLEFEVGSGDYGDDLETLVPPEAAALKTVLCLAQGQRILNYYLLAGGTNPELEPPEDDGSGRIAFTGERHGFAAPIDPEGRRTPALDALGDVLRAVDEHRETLAAGVEEHDALVYGFVADAYLTEYAHPAAEVRAAQVEALETHRFAGRRDTLGRALVLGGWRFGALDLQAWAGPGADADSIARSDAEEWARGVVPTGPGDRVLVLPGTRTLGRAVQEAIAAWVTRGGRLLLVGELPDRDDVGRPCALLADALGLADAGRVDEWHGSDLRRPDAEWEPTVVLDPSLHPRGDVRVSGTQRLTVADPRAATVLGTERGTAHPAVVEVRAGAGRALVIGADLPTHLEVWDALIERLGVRRGLRHDAALPGIVATTVAAPGGARLLAALNVAPYPLSPAFELDGTPLARIDLPARGYALIPVTR